MIKEMSGEPGVSFACGGRDSRLRGNDVMMVGGSEVMVVGVT